MERAVEIPLYAWTCRLSERGMNKVPVRPYVLTKYVCTHKLYADRFYCISSDLLPYALKLHITHPCTWLIDRLALPKAPRTSVRIILMKLFLKSKADIILLGPRSFLIVKGSSMCRYPHELMHGSPWNGKHTMCITHLLAIYYLAAVLCKDSGNTYHPDRWLRLRWLRGIDIPSFIYPSRTQRQEYKFIPSDEYYKPIREGGSTENEIYSNERFLARYGDFSSGFTSHGRGWRGYSITCTDAIFLRTDGDVYLHDGGFSVSKLMEIAIYLDFLERDLFKPPVINFRHAVEPHIFTQGKQRAKHDSVNLRIRVIH